MEVELLKGNRSLSLTWEGLVGCFGTCCRSSWAPEILTVSGKYRDWTRNSFTWSCLFWSWRRNRLWLRRIRLVVQTYISMRLVIHFFITWFIFDYFAIRISARCIVCRRISMVSISLVVWHFQNRLMLPCRPNGLTDRAPIGDPSDFGRETEPKPRASVRSVRAPTASLLGGGRRSETSVPFGVLHPRFERETRKGHRAVTRFVGVVHRMTDGMLFGDARKSSRLRCLIF